MIKWFIGGLIIFMAIVINISYIQKIRTDAIALEERIDHLGTTIQTLAELVSTTKHIHEEEIKNMTLNISSSENESTAVFRPLDKKR